MKFQRNESVKYFFITPSEAEIPFFATERRKK